MERVLRERFDDVDEFPLVRTLAAAAWELTYPSARCSDGARGCGGAGGQSTSRRTCSTGGAGDKLPISSFRRAARPTADANLRICSGNLEAPPGFEPGMEVLQTSALPLGDGAGRT